jgi:phasin family protein
MYTIPPSVTPAVRSHLDAQMAFFTDMSTSLTRSFQTIVELNMKLGQALLEETTLASQQLLSASSPTDAVSSAAARAQPASQKLQEYQQQVSRIAAEAQAELASLSEKHVQATSQTARQLADEVKRTATEQTERALQQQQETMKNFRDPFERAQSNVNSWVASPGSMQDAGASASAPSSGNAQDAQPGNK